MGVTKTLRLILISCVIAATALSQSSNLNDPVSLLAKKIEHGDTNLEYASDGWGYLRSLLKQLDLNIDSQILVFDVQFSQLS